jgi:hypothetical protein
VGKRFRQPVHQDLLEVDAIAVSDCAVLFSRIDNSKSPRIRQRDIVKGLGSILEFVRRLNGMLINTKDGPQILTTCSIDYGDFKYEDRIEVSNMKEVYFIGQPYVNAFLDNEFGEPKILPGQCRLLKENIDSIKEFPNNHPFSVLVTEEEKYYYYYWMVLGRDDIKRFKKEYSAIHQDVYKELKKLIYERCSYAP